MALVEKLQNNNARATIVLTGLTQGHDYRVQGVAAKCGHSFMPAQIGYTYVLKDVLVSSFKSRTVPLSADQLDSLRSVRIRDMTAGTKGGLRPAGHHRSAGGPVTPLHIHRRGGQQ